MTTPQDQSDWLHLKPYGYAPGGYMSRCNRCEVICYDLDKRATACRPCAEAMHAERLASLPALPEKAPAISVEMPDDGELESWRLAATRLRADPRGNLNLHDLRDAAVKLENAYLFAKRLREAAPAPQEAQHQPARCRNCDDTGDVTRVDGEWLGSCTSCDAADVRSFKSFHRSLCARFGYSHDEKDWRRDLVSLEEHIAKLAAQPQPQAREPLTLNDGRRLWKSQHDAHRSWHSIDWFLAGIVAGEQEHGITSTKKG